MGMEGLLLFVVVVVAVVEEMEQEEDVGDREGCRDCDLGIFDTLVISWSGATVAAGRVTSSDDLLRRFRFLPMVSSGSKSCVSS